VTHFLSHSTKRPPPLSSHLLPSFFPPNTTHRHPFTIFLSELFTIRPLTSLKWPAFTVSTPIVSIQSRMSFLSRIGVDKRPGQSVIFGLYATSKAWTRFLTQIYPQTSPRLSHRPSPSAPSTRTPSPWPSLLPSSATPTRALSKPTPRRSSSSPGRLPQPPLLGGLPSPAPPFRLTVLAL